MNARAGGAGVWGVARYLAECGYWVFPLSDGSKIPRRTHFKNGDVIPEAERLKLVVNGRSGFYAATRDVALVGYWAEQLPTANYGVACGRRGGVTVLDLDRHAADGVALFDEWCARFGTSLKEVCSKTFCVETPSNGLHIYFRWFEGKSRTVVSGVELQNEGRYVVGPGSQVKGLMYSPFEECEPWWLGEPPVWLPAFLENGANSLPDAVVAGAVKDFGSRKLCFSACLGVFGKVPVGYRHDAVYLECVGLVGDGWSEEAVLAELTELTGRWCPGVFSEGELRRNVDNAVRYVETEIEGTHAVNSVIWHERRRQRDASR